MFTFRSFCFDAPAEGAVQGSGPGGINHRGEGDSALAAQWLERAFDFGSVDFDRFGFLEAMILHHGLDTTLQEKSAKRENQELVAVHAVTESRVISDRVKDRRGITACLKLRKTYLCSS